ncbi:MAG: sodium:solute symporter [Cyclobacteriaceae bacterium]|nr:sodium:solute symporter [Cyclobacteriaceae bacterium]MCH8515127.1 sodium:solute symporter [Cyclobacteriaceae bacterium]
MNSIDWIVLLGTLFFIVAYGVYKNRQQQDLNSYLKGGNTAHWWTIGLSVMATQASAITFLSTPGQAYEDGMRFIQFYFGLPLAIIILSITFIPIYYKLKVYTAYEFLENRFDLKTRLLAAFLFLVQRGLAAGITIYAPAIILSNVLGWPLFYTNLLIGTLVIIYTVSGGTKAVSQTQKQQMAVILVGMVVAFGFLIHYLPPQVGFSEAMNIADHMGRLNPITFDFDPNDRYNIWLGLLGGFFLAMSYFGTDQSQVQRYLSGSSITQSRMGLIFNAILKIPMQFFILLVGVLVFVFYQFEQPPAFFNRPAMEELRSMEDYREELSQLEGKQGLIFREKSEILNQWGQFNAEEKSSYGEQLRAYDQEMKGIRVEIGQLYKQAKPKAEPKDTDYIFISFILDYLPYGLTGLLLAVIFSAAMSSTASELNALASTSIVDFYKRVFKKDDESINYVFVSRMATLFWGLLAIAFASFASMVDNLIQAVNILGSLFYGTILGIFLVAFYLKKIRGNSVFVSAIISESIVLFLFFYTEIGYLWFNVIGCLLVIFLSAIFEMLSAKKQENR